MSININLADKKNPEDSKKYRIKRLKGISFGLLFLTAFFSITIFVIDYRFSASYVRKQQADLMKELETYNEESAKIFLLNSKLSDISSILSQRKQYGKTVGEILKGDSESLDIDEFSIGPTGIYIKASSTSLLPIDEFLNYNLSLIKSKTISRVTLGGLNLEAGKYVLELRII